MKLEKGKISNSQLTFLIGAFIQGTLFCTSFLYSVTYRDIWIATLVSFFLFIIFSLVYINLMQSAPGKNLIQIDDIVYGPYLGKVISAAYIFFFIILSVANIRFVCDFTVGIFMGETPLIVFALMFVLLCAWAVNNGLEVMARASFVFLALVSISVILIFLLKIDQMEFKNFLPILRVPIKEFIQVNHILLSVFFGETFIFLMIIPYVYDQNKIKKSYLLGLLIGEITIFIVSVIITSTMDKVSTIVNNPLLVMVREIDVAKVITRMEFVIMCVIIFSVFIKVSAIYYAAALSLGQILNLKSYKSLIIPIGVIFIALTVPMFDNPISQAESGTDCWPIFATIFEILLPVVTLITAKIRGISAENGGEN